MNDKFTLTIRLEDGLADVKESSIEIDQYFIDDLHDFILDNYNPLLELTRNNCYVVLITVEDCYIEKEETSEWTGVGTLTYTSAWIVFGKVTKIEIVE